MKDAAPSPTGSAVAGAVARPSSPAAPPPCWIEPGLLPPQGILFVGGEPKVGKSLLVANLALALAAGKDRAGFPIPARAPRAGLPVRTSHPAVCRPAWRSCAGALGTAADHNLLVDTRAAGHLLSAPQGLNHFSMPPRQAAAEVIVLDPLYSTHDQDENDTRSMAALCQSLLRLRDASKAALIVVHHVRKSIGRDEIGSAFRGSRRLHAVGDSYMLLTRPSAQLAHRRAALPVPLRRAAAAATAATGSAHVVVFRRRLRRLPSGRGAAKGGERRMCTKALAGIGEQARYNQLREQIMKLTECSKRTAQLAITEACQQGWIVQADGQYRLPP